MERHAPAEPARTLVMMAGAAAHFAWFPGETSIWGPGNLLEISCAPLQKFLGRAALSPGAFGEDGGADGCGRGSPCPFFGGPHRPWRRPASAT